MLGLYVVFGGECVVEVVVGIDVVVVVGGVVVVGVGVSVVVGVAVVVGVVVVVVVLGGGVGDEDVIDDQVHWFVEVIGVQCCICWWC